MKLVSKVEPKLQVMDLAFKRQILLVASHDL